MSTQSPKPTVAELEEDIARTREGLADTVDELAARLDVKARARERLRQVTAPTAAAVAAVTAFAVVSAAILLRRRAR